MHIAFLTSEYPHELASRSAGIGASIKNITAGLVKHARVSIFIYGQDKEVVIKENGVTLHFIKHKKFKFFSWYFYRKHLQNYINRYIVKEHITAIEVPDWTGISAFMNLKCPIVIKCHGSDTYFCALEKRKQKFKNYFLEKKALKSADYILSVSKFTAETTKRLFNLSKRIETIPNAIDSTKFIPKPIAESNLTILYFGTLIRKKGVLEIPLYLNKVVEDYPDCQFVFAGSDVLDYETNTSTWELMKKLMTNVVKDNSTWLGSLPYSEMQDLINQASVILLPSYAEAMPMTWLEAMSMEKALVTSNIGWAKEVMIDGETGYMVNPKNHNEFANKIKALLGDEQLRQTLGTNARKQILKKFDNKIVLSNYISYYKKLTL